MLFSSFASLRSPLASLASLRSQRWTAVAWVAYSAASIVVTPHWGDHSVSADLSPDDTSATGSRQGFDRAEARTLTATKTAWLAHKPGGIRSFGPSLSVSASLRGVHAAGFGTLLAPVAVASSGPSLGYS